MKYEVQFQAFINLSDLTKGLKPKVRGYVMEMGEFYLDTWDGNEFVPYSLSDFIRKIEEELLDDLIKIEKPTPAVIKALKKWVETVKADSNLIGIDVILDSHSKATKHTSIATKYYLPHPATATCG